MVSARFKAVEGQQVGRPDGHYILDEYAKEIHGPYSQRGAQNGAKRLNIKLAKSAPVKLEALFGMAGLTYTPTRHPE